MSEINTENLQRCIDTLEKAYEMCRQAEPDSIDYELYRNALVKGFEMALEQSGKLLKKKITPYFSSKRAVDTLTFKDIFRHANKYALLNATETARWMIYRDNRNSTAHDYGEAFAEETLGLIEEFLTDAKHLKEVIDHD